MTFRTTLVLSLFVYPYAFCVANEEAVTFNRDIRPILSDKCFACHGPDEESRAGGFRLDLRDTAIEEADSGLTPILPGDPNGSELMRRIRSEDEYERMPPPESHKTLSEKEIDILKRWISEGAEWENHWSLNLPESVDPPQSSFAVENTGAIDRFILKKLEEEGLEPGAGADRVTLIRRVSFDLTGLPPALEDVDAFLADDQPGAYERLVDQILASERYGEHMARYWLDAARYGDTHGLHLDNYREMWPYRDWVVSAFNKNMPFDQFVLEQLAGDLLPEPTVEQLVASGFNRCHVTTNEGGSIAEEVYVRNVVDRVDTFGTVFLGMTVGCSRCHDHKYDPITMRDYYSLFAYFNSLDGNAMDQNRKDPAPALRVPTVQQRDQLAGLKKRISELEAKQLRDDPVLDEVQAEWENRFLGTLHSDAAVGADDSKSTTFGRNGLVLDKWHWVGPFRADQRYLKNQNQGPEGKEVDLEEEFELSTGEKVAWKPRQDWLDGQVHNDLTGVNAASFIYRKITAFQPQKIKLSLGSDDGIKVYHNGKEVLKNMVTRSVEPDQEQLELDLATGENHLLIKIVNFQGASGFYFKLASEQVIIPADLYAVAQIPNSERTVEQQKEIRSFYRNNISTDLEMESIREELSSLREKKASIDREVGLTLIWKEKASPRKAFMLNRGEYDQRGEEVARKTPDALPPFPSEASNDRLGLAKWLLDPSHPLTARVAVNRLWQQLFGLGLVKTSGDFGSQGERPSHPELLDWLAIDFRENGWDVKRLMKQLVTTDAYRRSARVEQNAYAKDPENRFLARGPRFRLDGEMLRDQALAVSGLLVNQLGGPSVKPPQPDGLWFAVGYSGSNTVRFAADKGHNKVHRRSLYTFIKRTAPPPQMSTFDGPSRESCVVRRERTNTPLQALLLLNDPQYVEAARALAERAMKMNELTDRERGAYMFRLSTSRYPSPEETERIIEAYREELAHYESEAAQAEELLSIGESLPAKSLDRSKLAAWTMVANVLLNLDEVVTKN